MKKLPTTYEEDKEFWEMAAKRPVTKLVSYLARTGKCWMCKHKFKEPLTKRGGTYYKGMPFSGEVAFHLHSTHGIDLESFIGMLEDTKEWKEFISKYAENTVPSRVGYSGGVEKGIK